MFKALGKTNPEVFPLIIREYAKLFYEHQDYATLDGWIVLACDGTKPVRQQRSNWFMPLAWLSDQPGVFSTIPFSVNKACIIP